MMLILAALDNLQKYCSRVSSAEDLAKSHKTTAAVYGELVLISKILLCEIQFNDLKLDLEDYNAFAEEVENGVDFLNGFNVGLIWDILTGKKLRFIKDILQMYLEAKFSEQKDFQKIQKLLSNDLINLEVQTLGR